MADQEQITRHEREIGELRGMLGSLATKEFVRSVVNEQTSELNVKFDAIDEKLTTLNERQHRITGAAEFLKAVLPLLISIATLIVLILSLILR